MPADLHQQVVFEKWVALVVVVSLVDVGEEA